MMKNYKYLFLLLLTLISCEKKPTNNYGNKIIGEWIFEKENPKRKNYFYTDFSYSFDKNGNCESKPGYYDTKEKTEKKERKTIFYGTKTKYKIEDDSLYIFNLVTKKWDASKIVGINTKNLKLNSEKNIVLEFSKIKYKENENENFDKIIISKSPCFGSCPINDIEINKNGNVDYSGSYYNSKNGFFKSKISSNHFNEIELSFKKTNYLNLEDKYSANWTDDQEVSVTFIKDNKIIKSITDYGRQSPKLFRINIEPLIYLYQKLKLVENKTIKDFQNINLRFEKGNKIINLTSSEVFYLSNLLSNSKVSNKTFKTDYRTEYDVDYDVSRIETDGRFFKIFSKKESSITLDLGFNFIEKNELTERMRLKTKYE
nr:DUF6438 domain-containing protein [uncultured Flavobacterium sp.]